MHLATFRGIPIRLHASFLLLAGLLIALDASRAGLASAAGAALLGAALFGSVLLHELGHALMARRFGIQTRSITLYPFGGVAALTREPTSPRAELLIALAGPAVNFALAAAAIPFALLGAPGAPLFLAMNLTLGLFNLLPAFPMDGGRVVRAWWAARMGRIPATRRAISLSRWFAWGFVALGLLYSPNLLLIGGFLLLTLAMERRRLQAAEAEAEAAWSAQHILARYPGWRHPAV